MRDLTALQRHPARVRVGYGLAAASAVLLAVLLVSEARARLVADHPSLGSRLASLLAGSPSPIDHPVIVVRPFENLGDPPSDDYVDLITDGLIRQLGKVEGLQVKAQATSFMLRGEPRDLSGIGKRLGVNLVIEGDARFSRERVLVRAALVSVTDGTPLWADEFDRTIGSEADITAAVGELARVIVNRLRLKLGATQLQDETDMATLKMYLRARKLHSERRTVEAVELYKKAIDADPGYAPALAELASAYGDQGTQYPRADGIAIPPREARAHLAPLVERALFINPTLAAAHAAMGFGHALALRWSDAEASFRRAIDLEPTRSTLHGHYVLAVLLPSGKLKEAMDVLEMALLNDPLSLDLRTILARVQLNAGLYDDALENCRRVLEEDPSFPFVAGHAAWARVFRGDRAEALEWFENFYADGLRPGVMGWIHAINGRRAEAEAIAARFNHLPLRQAEIYGLLGQKEKVLEALERQADLNPIRAAFYLTQPELGLRGDPRVEEFRRRRLGFVN
jgi:TolB-like protein/Tfp pilus assembly protein PilF